MLIAPEFRQQVFSASGRLEVSQALAGVYADLQKVIDARRPVCLVSGRCCRFEEFGHRLFVTTIEMAEFVRQADLTMMDRWDGTGCPYQVNKLCTVHAIRPFGCRLFFCDASAGQWQNEQYEFFHARLKALHESLAVRYFYVEWRDALRAIRSVTQDHVSPETP